VRTVVASDDPLGVPRIGIVVETEELRGKGAGDEKRSRVHWGKIIAEGAGEITGGVSPAASIGRGFAC
jgi:hypothetical protein